MAQYGDQYGHVQNQEVDIQKVHDNTGINSTEPGIVTHEALNGLSSGQQPQAQQENLRRSASSSSSSSEDEGEGGIKEKKGLPKKIMEKIPGVGPKEPQSHDIAATTTTMPGEGGNDEEKKGIVDKIKEKLPGHN